MTVVNRTPEALLERDQELARIGALITDVREGAGRLVVIEGPPGIGKTRLLAAATSLAAGAGFAVLSARCSPIEAEFSFGVARQLFEWPLRALSGAQRRRMFAGAAALARPVIAGIGDVPVGTIFPSLHGLYWLSVNLADDGPLVVVVDDAHWADEASLQWLVYLARRLEDVQVLVLVAARPELRAQAPLLGTLTTEPGVQVLRLSPLTQEGAAELTQRAVGPAANAGFVRLCHTRTGGNPFLLHELLAEITSEGIDGSSAEAEARLSSLRPGSVSRTVLGRLNGLPEPCASLARAVAVLQSDVEARQAAELAGVELTQVPSNLDMLVAADILRRGEPLAFVHPLVRDAVYDDIPDGRRGELHLGAARLLKADGAASERVAAHLLAAPCAGDNSVVDWLAEAARVAVAQGASQAAARYLKRALAEPPPLADRGALLRELGEVQARWAPSLAVEPLQKALALSTDPVERSMIRFACGNALSISGQPVEGYGELERGVADLPADSDRELKLRMEAEMMSIGLLAPALATRVAELIASLPRLEGVTPGERLVLANLSRHRSLVEGDWRGAAELADIALAGGQLLYDQRVDSGLFPMTMMPLAVAGRLNEMDALVELIFDDAARRGSAVGHALATYCVARRHDIGGDVRSSEAAARRALELALECGWATGVPLALSCLVSALIERGRLDEAEELLELHGMAAVVPDTVSYFKNILLGRGRLRILQQRHEEGLADLLEIGRRERESGWSEERAMWRSFAAPALLARGAGHEAIVLATEAVAQARARETPGSEGAALRALGNVLGGQPGITKLREAVTMLAPLPFRLEYAHALADLGAALRRSNQRAEARGPLREALDLAVRCGADALEQTARTELRATGARPRNVMLAGVESLTTSEYRVAALAARGQSNPQIAQQLFVTRKTVEVHLGSTYRKLNISSRDQLQAALSAP